MGDHLDRSGQPRFQSHDRLRVGEDIVQEYHSDSRGHCQWMFTEISQDSFHWISRESRNDGDTWNVRTELFLHRRALGKSAAQPAAARSGYASPEHAFDF